MSGDQFPTLFEENPEALQALSHPARLRVFAAMPVGEYYKGHGDEVMRKMKKRYGGKRGERVFYATANKRGMNRPRKKKRKAHSRKVGHRRGRGRG